MGRLLLVAALAAATACADLERLPVEACGNAVVEAGEDCDRFAAAGEATACGEPGTFGECRYVCAEGGASCPSGWGCGEGGICRRPSGAFAEVAGAAFPVDTFDLTATEIDGDGDPDLVGYKSSAMWARFGAGDGRFAEPFDLGFEFTLAGPPALGDLDGDQRTDVLMVGLRGFATLRGVAGKTFEQAPHAMFQLASSGGVRLEPIRNMPGTPFSNGTLLVASTGSAIALQMLEGQYDPLPPLILPLALDLDALTGLPHADLDGDDSMDEFALVFAGEDRVWVYGVVANPWGPQSIAARGEVLLPGPAGDGGWFADRDGDGALDLIVGAAGGIVVALGDGGGGFGPAVFDDGLPAPLLAAGDLDGDGRADFVAADGVYVDVGGPVELRAFPAGVGWSAAALGDFNRDGLDDVAAARTGGRTIEVLRTAASGWFSRSTLETEGFPERLAAGDFDGDRVTDLAIAEDEGEESGVWVAFGAVDGTPSPPSLMGRFPRVEVLAPAYAAFTAIGSDVTADLVVQTAEGPAPADPRAISVLMGSSGRRMVAGFDLKDVPYAAAIGRFAPAGDANHDVALVAAQIIWLVGGRGSATLLQDDRAAHPVIQLVDGTFEPRCALLAAGDLDGNGDDELVGIDRCVPAPTLMVVAFVGGGIEALFTPFDAPYAYAWALALRDLDGDALPELIVTWAGDGETGRGAVVYWNDGGSLDTAGTLVPGSELVDAVTPISADTDEELELAVATDERTYLVDVLPNRELAARAGDLVGGPVERLVAADVTRDELEDLIVFDGFEVHVWAALPEAD